MSGHNKWAQIKRKKAVTDQRRGRIFSQVIKEITIAAKEGGGHPDGNARLRLAIEKAKASNMPAENIKRAVMRGTGELPGTNYEEVAYEAYGPGGAAIIIETVTDNRNRTVSDLRHILERHHGKLANAGSVAFQFHKKGLLNVPRSATTEDALMALALEAGADDLRFDEHEYMIICSPAAFHAVKQAVEAQRIPVDAAEMQLLADSTHLVAGKDAEHLLRLMDALEEHDDVQKVHSNFEIDEHELAALTAGL